MYFYSHPSGTARCDVNKLAAKPFSYPVSDKEAATKERKRADVVYPLTTVTNSQLLVHGFANLRVCDSSVFGKPVVGHTDAPTRMVGLNCAKMIGEKYDSEMPLNGYGTNVKIKPFHIQYYLEKGGRLIDTAQTYGNAKVIGMGLNLSKKPREAAFIATKIGPDKFDDVYG